MAIRKIAIIGGGEIGQAIVTLFPKNIVHIWDRDKTQYNRNTMEETVANADLVFLCIPSWAIIEVVPKLAKLVSNKTYVVSLAKGVCKPKGYTTAEFLGLHFKANQIGVLAGPMLAEEIMAKQPTIGILGCSNRKLYEQLKQTISAKFFQLQHTTDIAGASLAGVVKNVYAIALGMAECIKVGHNTRAWLITHMVEEMRSLPKALGGKTETYVGLAGLGDLIATGSSTDSTHFSTGQELITHGSCSLNSEGMNSIDMVWRRLSKHKAHFPIIGLLHRIANNKKTAKKLFVQYINHG